MTLSQEELDEFSARTARERVQAGLPATIRDHAALAAIAAILRRAEQAEEREARPTG